MCNYVPGLIPSKARSSGNPVDLKLFREVFNGRPYLDQITMLSKRYTKV